MLKRLLALTLCLCLLIGVCSGLTTASAVADSVKYSASELILKTTDDDTYDYFLINNFFTRNLNNHLSVSFFII